MNIPWTKKKKMHMIEWHVQIERVYIFVKWKRNGFRISGISKIFIENEVTKNENNISH